MVAIEAIEEFKIHDIIWNPSDHTPISITLKLNMLNSDYTKCASADILTERFNDQLLKPKKIVTSDVNWDGFQRLVESDSYSYQDKVDNLKSDPSLESLDSLVNQLSKSVYNAASVNSSCPTDVDTKSDNDILHTMEDFLSNHHVGDDNAIEWQRVRDEAVEHLRKDVSHKDRLNWNMALNSSDSRALWTAIDWKGSFTTTDTEEKPDLDDLAAHFAAKGQAGRDSSVLCEVSGNSNVPMMDNDITIEEIVSAQKEMKDKSSGDGWVKKMVTSLPASMLLLLQLIYNTILKYHVFPTSWRTTVVGEIFKNKGIRSEGKNYRGISLVQLLAKLFDIIILKRFKGWFKPADEQTAYQSERGSPDHVFLLRCIMQYAK